MIAFVNVLFFSDVRCHARRTACALAMGLLLAACGGGGGGGTAAADANTARAGTATSAATSASDASAASGATAAGGASGASGAASASGAAASTAASSAGAAAAAPTSTDLSSPSANLGTTATSSTTSGSTNVASGTGSSASGSAPASTAKFFYGANGHNNEGGAYDISSPAVQLQQLQDLGVKVYRNEVYNLASANKLAGIARTMAAGGVTIYPVMLKGISDVNTETDGYNAGFTLGQQTATAYRYAYYEVSNELAGSVINTNVDGVSPQQYDNARFQLARGVIRGMIAGVKSVDSNATIVMGGNTWLHYGFLQMLANGTQPDGSAGYPAVSWDITAWHWYSNMNNITNACGGTGCHDVLAELQKFGKPIWINEFGVRPTYGSDQQIATYMTGTLMMAQFASVASKYDVESIQVYELYDDPVGGEGPYGLLRNDGVTTKPAYDSFKQFVAANPR